MRVTNLGLGVASAASIGLGWVAWGAGAPSLEAGPPPGPAIAMSLNTRDLLSTLVGPDVVLDAVVYVPVPPEIAEMADAERAFTTVQYVATFRQGDAERAFVVLSTNADGHDCHACAPRVGLASLTHVVDAEGLTGWRVDRVQASWASMGAYGMAPRFELEQVGPQRYALRSEIGDMHQGYLWGAATWVIEGPDGFREAAALSTYSSNEGMCGPDVEPCVEEEAMTRFEPGKARDVWDLVVLREGTRLQDGGVKPVPRLERWAWSPSTQTWSAPKPASGR
jgi:hypothetical protein